MSSRTITAVHCTRAALFSAVEMDMNAARVAQVQRAIACVEGGDAALAVGLMSALLDDAEGGDAGVDGERGGVGGGDIRSQVARVIITHAAALLSAAPVSLSHC